MALALVAEADRSREVGRTDVIGKTFYLEDASCICLVVGVGEVCTTHNFFIGVVLYKYYDAQLLLIGVIFDGPIRLVGVRLALKELSGEGSALSVGENLTCAEIEILLAVAGGRRPVDFFFDGHDEEVHLFVVDLFEGRKVDTDGEFVVFDVD